MADAREPDDLVRLTVFGGICIPLTIVVLIILRALFPVLQYPLTLVTPYGTSVVAAGALGFVLGAWRKSAPAATNFIASALCFVAPAVTLYAMIAISCWSIALQCR